MQNIFISCGHNNARNWGKDENGRLVLWMSKDQWAVNPLDKEQTEYRWVSRVATSLQKLTNVVNPSYNYIFVPAGLNLADRIKWINKNSKDFDICIELHMNAGWGSGIEVFCMAWAPYAHKKATELSSIMSSSMGLYNRWAKIDTNTRFWRLWFIRDTKPLAFLIELWFIDNAHDRDVVWVKGASALKLALWTIKF